MCLFILIHSFFCISSGGSSPTSSLEMPAYSRRSPPYSSSGDPSEKPALRSEKRRMRRSFHFFVAERMDALLERNFLVIRAFLFLSSSRERRFEEMFWNWSEYLLRRLRKEGSMHIVLMSFFICSLSSAEKKNSRTSEICSSSSFSASAEGADARSALLI